LLGFELGANRLVVGGGFDAGLANAGGLVASLF
jgi:hypothetical protein